MPAKPKAAKDGVAKNKATKLAVSVDKSESDQAARAAWLHYVGGLTQSEVAKKLGLNNLKAHRLINKAHKEGLVKFYIDGDITECIELENRISELFDLDYCEVVPEYDEDDLPLRALGHGGAQFLRREMDNDRNSSIGVGHGRTLAACVDNLPGRGKPAVQFVSLLGGLSRNYSANPHDVIHRLSQRTGAEAYVMPVPFLANSLQDMQVLMHQHGIQDVLDLARQTELKLVGIGTNELHSVLLGAGMIEQSELDAVADAGGVGEILGYFFGEDGQVVETEITRRTVTLSLDDLSDSRIVAIAGGKFKTRAIKSVLNSRLLSGLITDERTARSLVQLDV